MASWPELARGIAYVGLAVGLVGTVAPGVPGPALIWASAFLWAWSDGFLRVGWPTLALLGAMALAAEAANIAFTLWGARRGGGSWRSFALAALAALAGGAVLSLPGALLGASLGFLGAELRRHGGDWRRALRAGGFTLWGYLLATSAQFGIGLAMTVVFLWQASSRSR